MRGAPNRTRYSTSDEFVGNNPTKSFSVVQGTGASHVRDSSDHSLKKDFDGTIKGNVFVLEGHKVQIPSATADKGAKLEIVHRYLVLQMFLASGDPFSLELQIKDKQNVSR